jgi:hypothetical protein
VAERADGSTRTIVVPAVVVAPPQQGADEDPDEMETPA